MPRFFSLIIIFVMPLLAWADPGGDGRYRIKVIIPLSGQVASLGGYVKEAITLAHEDLEPAMRERISISYDDDQFDPKQTVSAYQRALAAGTVDAVFVIGSPPAIAVAPLTERNSDILIAIGASDPAIVRDRRSSFIHWVIPPVLGKLLASELSERGYRRIGFITAQGSGALADTKAATDALRAMGLGERIVYDESFDIAATDYRAAISALKAKKADAVVAVLFPGALASFAKQFKQAGLEAQLFGMETFEDEGEVKAAQGALFGGLYVNATDPGSEFIGRYKRRFNRHPGWGTGNAYDAVVLMARAVTETDGTAERVRAFLASVKDFRGACGTYSASGDNRFLLPAALKRVTEDGFESIPTEESG